MGRLDEKESLSVSQRDFSPRWHLTTVGILVAFVLAAYFLATKLILN